MIKKINLKEIFVVLFIALISILGKGYSQPNYNRALLDSISHYIDSLEIKHSDIVLRQIIIETGWLKSDHFLKKNSKN